MEHIIGTHGADDIEMFRESQPLWIAGRGGNDTLVGGYGDDLINGGKGDDDLQGGAGADILRGGAGNDRLDGGDPYYAPAADVLYGGDGNDQMGGGAGDTLHGGDGNDNMIGVEGGVTALGEAGDDTIALFGPTWGTADGGDGNDVITVDNGLGSGGSGDDQLFAGHLGFLTGGPGADLFGFGTGQDGVQTTAALIDFHQGEDKILLADQQGFDVFARLDLNHDGRLDPVGDAGAVTTDGYSLALHLNGGEDTVWVGGAAATGLAASDFITG